jgi:hypothetical protein
MQALLHHETQQRLNSSHFLHHFLQQAILFKHPHFKDSADEDYTIRSDTTTTSTAMFTSTMTDSTSVTTLQSELSSTTSTNSSSEFTSSSIAPPLHNQLEQ